MRISAVQKGIQHDENMIFLLELRVARFGEGNDRAGIFVIAAHYHHNVAGAGKNLDHRLRGRRAAFFGLGSREIDNGVRRGPPCLAVEATVELEVGGQRIGAQHGPLTLHL